MTLNTVFAVASLSLVLTAAKLYADAVGNGEPLASGALAHASLSLPPSVGALPAAQGRNDTWHPALRIPFRVAVTGF